MAFVLESSLRSAQGYYGGSLAGCEHTYDAALKMQQAVTEWNWPKLTDIKFWLMEELPPVPEWHKKPALVSRGDIVRALIYLAFLMLAQVMFPLEAFAVHLLVALGWWLTVTLIMMTLAGWMIRLGAELHCHCNCDN